MSHFTAHRLPEVAPDRPLLICDVDEVVLHYVSHFEDHLAEHGHYLEKTSLKLFGNVKSIEKHVPASVDFVKQAVSACHQKVVTSQQAVENSIETLDKIANTHQIVFLTNVNEELGRLRTSYLAELGAPYPLIANQGDKSSVIAKLADRVEAQTSFVDDLFTHLQAATQAAPKVQAIHFMADEPLRKLTQQMKLDVTYSDSWSDILSHLTFQV